MLSKQVFFLNMVLNRIGSVNYWCIYIGITMVVLIIFQMCPSVAAASLRSVWPYAVFRLSFLKCCLCSAVVFIKNITYCSL